MKNDNLNPIEVFSMEEFLKESPNLYSHNVERHEDWNGNNEKEAQRIIDNSEYLGIFDYKGLKYKLYSKKEKEYIFYYLLHSEWLSLLFLHQVLPTKLINLNGIESVDIWQNHALRDFTSKLATYWVFNYILKNYNFIMSDKLHTPLGKHFWFKLLKESLEKKLNMVVYDIRENKHISLNNLDNFDDFYGNEGKGHFRFIIFK